MGAIIAVVLASEVILLVQLITCMCIGKGGVSARKPMEECMGMFQLGKQVHVHIESFLQCSYTPLVYMTLNSVTSAHSAMHGDIYSAECMTNFITTSSISICAFTWYKHHSY